MPHQTDRLTWNSLIFHHAVVFLLLTHSHEGQCQGNGQSSELIGALLGESITLPCQLNPATDAVNAMLEWARPDLDPRFVHVRRDGEDRLFDQHPSYKGRTSVSIDGLRRGDMSLELSKVTFSDQGTYRCFVPGFDTDTSVKLVVDVFIKITNVSRGVLQCESTGWYPEPEVFWLDGEGNLLSAGPTETVRGPDDLYTVSSRVTVEKSHSNSFTCRVQQNSTNQTRETKIHVSDDFFKEPSGSGSTVAAVIFALAGVTSVLAACFVFWKRKQKRNNSKPNLSDEETTGGSDASKQDTEAGEDEPLMNQSKVDEAVKSKYEQTGQSKQTEEEKQSEKFRKEAEENVGTGSQCVMENERQQHEVQTKEELNNREKETKSVSEGSSDQEETEKKEKGEDTGDRVGGTKSETEGQDLMEGGQEQPVGVGGEANTDPHKTENKEPTQTESAGQSPTDEGGQRDQPPARDGTNPGLEKKREDTKPVSEGSPDQAETETEKPEKGEETGDQVEGTKSETEGQSLMEGGQQQPVRAGGEANTDPHKTENNEQTQTESAGQRPTDGGTQGDQTPAGQGTHHGLEKKKEDTKDGNGGGGDKTTSTKENSTPQSPVDEQTAQLKDTDGQNAVDQSDKNKEAEKSTDNVTGGQRQTAAQTQHKDRTDEESKSDDDTDSASNGRESPSPVNPQKNIDLQTDKKPGENPGSSDMNQTSEDNVTTPDQTSEKDGKRDVGEKEDDNSQRVNDHKNGADDTDA